MAVLFMVGVAGLLSSFEVESASEPTGSAVSQSSAQALSLQTPAGVPATTREPQFTAATVVQNTPQARRKMLELPQNLLKSAGDLTEDFEAAAEWVKVSGTAPLSDAVNIKSGLAGLKLISAAEKSLVEKKVNWNLGGSECMRLWVYRPKRNANTFEIWLATKTNFSQYFRKEVKPNPIGWTLVQICKEEFTGVREADWNDPVVKIRLQVNPNDELTFDTLMTQVEPVPAIMIQFDDANESDYSVAFPILRKYGMRATTYVPTGLVGTPNVMSVAQLLELQRSGWVIGNHTVNHVLLRDLPADTQEKEIAGALAALHGWGLQGGQYMAYPWGKYNTDTLAIMTRLGMLSGRTVSNAPDVFPQVNQFILRGTQDVGGLSLADLKKMVDAAKINRHSLTLVFHALTPNAAQGDEWNGSEFEQIIAYIASQKLTTLTIDEFVKLAQGSVQVEIPGETP